MRILFTGMTSFAGEGLYASLARNHDVDGVSRQNNVAARFVLDLSDREALEQLAGNHYDIVVHFASFVPRNERESSWNPCYKANVLGTANLFEALDGKINRVVYASSCAVYGSDKDYHPTDEEHPLRPDTAYAISKCAQEQLVRAYCLSRGIPCATFRLGYVYGPGIGADRAVRFFVRMVKDRDPITLKDPDRSGLQLIHVDDITRIMNAVVNGDGRTDEVYNLAYPGHLSLREYVDAISEVLDVPATVEYIDRGGPITNYYSCEKLEHDRGLKPEVSISEGISSMIGAEIS